MNAALCIFVKNPRLGKVKTRLAAGVGHARALEIYKAMLLHTHSICSSIQALKYVFYSDEPEVQDIWKDPFKKEIQHNGDLGARMQHAFTMLFEKGFERVVIIGSDCMELTGDIINTAFESLAHCDVVIGPALDGGYYLLGLKKMEPALFTAMPWSTDKVFAQTQAVCDEHGLSYSLLQPLRDIDREEDWTHFTRTSEALPG